MTISPTALEEAAKAIWNPVSANSRPSAMKIA